MHCRIALLGSSILRPKPITTAVYGLTENRVALTPKVQGEVANFRGPALNRFDAPRDLSGLSPSSERGG